MATNPYQDLLSEIPLGVFYDPHGTILPYSDQPYSFRFSTPQVNTRYSVLLNGNPVGAVTTDATGVALVKVALILGNNVLTLSNTAVASSLTSYISTRNWATWLASTADILGTLDDQGAQILLDRDLATVSFDRIDTVWGRRLRNDDRLGYSTDTYRELLQGLVRAYRRYGGRIAGIQQAIGTFTHVNPLVLRREFGPRWTLGNQLATPPTMDSFSGRIVASFPNLSGGGAHITVDPSSNLRGEIGSSTLAYNTTTHTFTWTAPTGIVGTAQITPGDTQVTITAQPATQVAVAWSELETFDTSGWNKISLELDSKGIIIITLTVSATLSAASVVTSINTALAADARYGATYNASASAVGGRVKIVSKGGPIKLHATDTVDAARIIFNVPWSRTTTSGPTTPPASGAFLLPVATTATFPQFDSENTYFVVLGTTPRRVYEVKATGTTPGNLTLYGNGDTGVIASAVIVYVQGQLAFTWAPPDPATFPKLVLNLTSSASLSNSSDAFTISGSTLPTGWWMAPWVNTNTNMVSYSQSFDNAYWTKTNATLATSAATAPDGTSTAQDLIDNSTNGGHQFAHSVTLVVGQTYTWSIWVRAGTANYNILVEADASIKYMYFNPTTATFVNTGLGASAIKVAYPNGWYRISFSFVADVVSKTFFVAIVQAPNTPSYAGSTNFITIWGAQAELAASASTYMPTPTAAPTVSYVRQTGWMHDGCLQLTNTIAGGWAIYGMLKPRVSQYAGMPIDTGVWVARDYTDSATSTTVRVGLSFDGGATWTAASKAIPASAARIPTYVSVSTVIPAAATSAMLGIFSDFQASISSKLRIEKVTARIGSHVGRNLGRNTTPRNQHRSKRGYLCYVWAPAALTTAEKALLGLPMGVQGHIDSVSPTFTVVDRFEITELLGAVPQNLVGVLDGSGLTAGTLTNLTPVIRAPTRFTYLMPTVTSMVLGEVITWSGGPPYQFTLSRISSQNLLNVTLYESGIPLTDTQYSFVSGQVIQLGFTPDPTKTYTIDYETLIRFESAVCQVPGTASDRAWYADVYHLLGLDFTPQSVPVIKGVQFDGNFVAPLDERSDQDQSTSSLIADDGTSAASVDSSSWEYVSAQAIRIDPTVFNSQAIYTLDYNARTAHPEPRPIATLEYRQGASSAACSAATYAPFVINQPVAPAAYVQFRITYGHVLDVNDVRLYSVMLKGLNMNGTGGVVPVLRNRVWTPIPHDGVP